jgi:putative methyltransferase (TIGR04325 family)
MRQELKNLVKDWCPPALLRWLRNPPKSLVAASGGAIRRYGFAGNYGSYAQASGSAPGYAAGNILEKAREALLKVKNGEAACERDTVLFDHIQYSYPLLANLLHVAGRNDGHLTVLDFGGALGSSYYQNRGYLSHLRELNWMVVEQPHFVTCGKADFADGRLSFHETVEAAIAHRKPDVILLSSVLQYLEDPPAMVRKLTAAGVGAIIVDRAPVVFDVPTRLTLQTVPPSIYEAAYPCWLFNEQAFIELFEPAYRLSDRFDANIGATFELEDAIGRYRGYLFEPR